jgi:hypothetical protein
MKKVTMIALLLMISAVCYSQNLIQECWQITKNEWKTNKVSYISFAVSGIADAGAEVFDADDEKFRGTLGISDDSKFAGVNCLNNWRTSNMPMASTLGAPFVDIYHNMRAWETTGYIIGIVFMVGEKRQNWKVYAIRSCMLFAANKIPFNLTMHGLFAMPF